MKPLGEGGSHKKLGSDKDCNYTTRAAALLAGSGCARHGIGLTFVNFVNARQRTDGVASICDPDSSNHEQRAALRHRKFDEKGFFP
jgi:hypothetical protein